MTRFTQLAVAGLATLACAAQAPERATPPTRPNILWLIAEDLGPELGSYGHPEAYTPNLDRLASSGVRYTHAYTVAPVCSVSRSAFMTGMHALTIDAHNHRSHRSEGDNPLPEGVRVLTGWLQSAGYYTVSLRDAGSGIGGSGKDDFNFSVPGRVWDSHRWADLATHQPFYAQVSYGATHRMGRRPDIPSRITRPADPAKVRIPPYYPDHPVTRQDWATYLDSIQEMDGEVTSVPGRLGGPAPFACDLRRRATSTPPRSVGHSTGLSRERPDGRGRVRPGLRRFGWSGSSPPARRHGRGRDRGRPRPPA